MRRFVAAAVFSLTCLASSSALAWGAQGHQIIGSIAQQIIKQKNPALYDQIMQTLGGYDLSVAATWADCVRDVSKSGDTFSYHTGKYTPAACMNFQSDDEKARMIAYASANWTQCVYKDGGTCHETYHFADVPIQEDHYDRSEAGTSEFDVVSVINAAILTLQGKPYIGKIQIPDKKDALLLLAHFVGDVHQPLHVGAIYLDAQGNPVNPDTDTTVDVASANTRGGNSIMDGQKNLHSEWDTVPKTWPLTVAATGTARAPSVARAQNVPDTSGTIDTWAATWATDTVMQSHAAFDGLTYGAKDGTWPVTEPAGYASKRAAEQRVQLEKAGARLAQVLLAIGSLN